MASWTKERLQAAVSVGDVAPEVAVGLVVDDVVFDAMPDRTAALIRDWGTANLGDIGALFRRTAPALPGTGTVYYDPSAKLCVARAMPRGLVTFLVGPELTARTVLTLAYDFQLDGFLFPEMGLDANQQVTRAEQLLVRAKEVRAAWGCGLVVATHSQDIVLHVTRGTGGPDDVLGYWVHQTPHGECWELLRLGAMCSGAVPSKLFSELR